MGEVLAKYRHAGLTSVVIGDIFLDDLRKYREDKLKSVDMQGIFSIWKRNNQELARSLIALGFKAITTCVDTTMLDGLFVGRVINEQFLSELPATIDPCGENGEYHSFVQAGLQVKKRIGWPAKNLQIRWYVLCKGA